MNPYNVLPLFRQGVFHGKNANIHLFCVGRRYISMTKDMTQGSPLKLLLAFAVPLMLAACSNSSTIWLIPSSWGGSWAWKRWRR